MLLALVAAFLAPGDKLMLLGHEVPRAALWFGGGLGAGLLLPAAILWLLMTSVMVAIEMAQALIDFCKWLFKAGLVIAGLYGVFWLMSSL